MGQRQQSKYYCMPSISPSIDISTCFQGENAMNIYPYDAYRSQFKIDDDCTHIFNFIKRHDETALDRLLSADINGSATESAEQNQPTHVKA